MDEDQRKEELVSIGSDVDRLTAMLDKVVALQRSDSVLFDLEPRPVHVGQLCRRIADKASLATKGRHEVALHGGDEVGVISVDAQLLEHILSNLISNAIKYSADGGKVDVLLGREDNMFKVEVVDYGIGIPPVNSRGSEPRFTGQEIQGRFRVLALVLSLPQEPPSAMAAI
jgi:signal transduction histidine kinase